jgi:hypothetical protein
VVATGDGDVQEVGVRESGEVDIAKELGRLREAIEGLDLTDLPRESGLEYQG